MPEGYNDHFTADDRKALIECGFGLRSVNEKLDDLKLSVEGHAGRAETLEARVRQLENFRWLIAGAAATSGLVGALVSKLILK